METYTYKEAAEYLGRCVRGLKRAHQKGRLKGWLRSARLRLFTQEELDQFDKDWPKYKREVKK